ncbi:hypothetical protein CEXT_786871, partial [Caerostris extrusa]
CLSRLHDHFRKLSRGSEWRQMLQQSGTFTHTVTQSNVPCALENWEPSVGDETAAAECLFSCHTNPLRPSAYISRVCFFCGTFVHRLHALQWNILQGSVVIRNQLRNKTMSGNNCDCACSLLLKKGCQAASLAPRGPS